MKSFSLAVILLSGLNTISALGIDDTDVPAVCAPICKPLIDLSSACSSDSSTDSDCICSNTSFNVKDLGSMCAICCQQANSLNDGEFFASLDVNNNFWMALIMILKKI
jgi:hypothetical protein